jgi:hypothetical protein
LRWLLHRSLSRELPEIFLKALPFGQALHFKKTCFHGQSPRKRVFLYHQKRPWLDKNRENGSL